MNLTLRASSFRIQDLAEMERNSILRDMGFVPPKRSLFLGNIVHLSKFPPNEGITQRFQYTLGTVALCHNLYADIFRQPIVRSVEKVLRTQSSSTRATPRH